MRGIGWVTGFAALACAQHLGLEIPQVNKAVEAALEKFDKYVHYKAPAGAPKKPAKVPSHKSPLAASCSYWLDEIPHDGVAAFNSDSSYPVYRNVMDYGATGNGQTDDTAAIQSAISAGNRCAPGSCEASTTTPAVVYFPPGTYLISSSLIDYYETQLIGNPNCMPTILAAPDFGGQYIGLVDADPYQSGGSQAYGGSTNIFYRQIRNIIFDTTQVASSSSIAAIHWPTAQATSVTNCVFNLGSGTQHIGMFIENGSAGFLGDLVFNGGLYGLNVGNQQFTMRNLTFNNGINAINMLWDWGFVWQGLNINNVQNAGIVMNANSGGTTEVGSVTVLDSSFSNCPIAIVANRNSAVSPTAANSIILENISLNNVPVVVQNAGSTSLAGSSGQSTVTAWGQGISYTPNGPNTFQGNIPVAGNGRPANLLSGDSYRTLPKPEYAGYSTSQVVTVRSHGATGNGQTDDTTAFQNAINAAVSSNSLLFVDQGDYLVTKTLSFPPGLLITGESYPVILSSGSFFNNINSPQPVVQIGTAGQSGRIQWSNMIVSTQGQQQGAILIEYNLNSGSSDPSGIWDVHTRIGGFTGSNLQVAQCPTTPGTTITSSNLNTNCIAAFMSMHVTSQSTGLYMENTWFWTADHDIDSASETQVTIYTGRGLLVESQGPTWLVGTAVEHHSKYQYQFNNAKDVYAGFIQTETPYYQPNPGASIPFPTVSSLADPTFPSSSSGASTVDAWGLRIVSSSSILIYGAGHYSFFDNQSTSCSDQGTDNCQQSIINLSGSNTDITIYTLNTVGVVNAINNNGNLIGSVSATSNGFEDTIAWFTTNT